MRHPRLKRTDDAHMSCSVDDLAVLNEAVFQQQTIPIPEELIEAQIPLWRGVTKGLYHWTATGCRHMAGSHRWASDETTEPTEYARAVGFSIPSHKVCKCSKRMALSPMADIFVGVGAEVVRAVGWIEEGRQAAEHTVWNWSKFATWRAREPLRGHRWCELADRINDGQWGCTGEALAERIPELQSQAAETVSLLASRIPSDAVRSALLRRAAALVAAETPVKRESAILGRIFHCPGSPGRDSWFSGRQSSTRGAGCVQGEQEDFWGMTAATWILKRERGKELTVDYMCKGLEHETPHVHDLAALPSYPEVVPQRGDLQECALRMANHHRRIVVGEWISRLETAFGGLDCQDQQDQESTHLLVGEGWPWSDDQSARSLAYLTQFDIAAGPITLYPNHYGLGGNQVAVLRIPEWAALHVMEQFPNLVCEPLNGVPTQALSMLHRHGGAEVTTEEFRHRRTPSLAVERARDERHSDTASAAGEYGRVASAEYRRPLRKGAPPPELYRGSRKEWGLSEVQYVLDRRTGFVFGHDNLKLLAMAFRTRDYGLSVRIGVELQAGCRWHPDEGVHVCEVEGILRRVDEDEDGSVAVELKRVDEQVVIPAAYLVDFAVT